MNHFVFLKQWKTLLAGNKLFMRWHQSLSSMILFTLNIKTIFPPITVSYTILNRPGEEESPEIKTICKYCRKNGHSILRSFEQQTNKYRQVNFESGQQYDAQSKSGTPKMFKDYSKKTKLYQVNVLLLPMFHHTNKKTVLPHTRCFKIILLPQDKKLLHSIIEKDIPFFQQSF